MATHAFLSASGAPSWMLCAAKPWREREVPQERSVYADEGTVAHYVMSESVLHGRSPSYMRYLRLFVDNEGGVHDTHPTNDGDNVFEVTEEMVDAVERVLRVTEGRKLGVNLFTEQRLDISQVTTEKGAGGTSDLVLLDDSKITIVDLKYGFGKIYAEDNEQLLLYAAGALSQFDLLGEIDTVSMRIEQPRICHSDEWTIPVSELKQRIIPIRAQAERILAAKGGENLPATPGSKQCAFCSVKANCPEYLASTFNKIHPELVITDSSRDIVKKVQTAAEHVVYTTDDHLAKCMDAVEAIENWCDAVRTEVFKRLSNSTFKDGYYKLVTGRAGARKFTDEKYVEKLLIDYKLKEEEIYDIALKSPAQLENFMKKAYPDKWEELQVYIDRTPGRRTVVPWKDKRPAINDYLEFTDYTKDH